MRIKADTLARTILLALSLINLLLSALGKLPLQIEESVIYDGCSIAFVMVASIWAWWKNNSFTKAAIKADATLTESKALNTANKRC